MERGDFEHVLRLREAIEEAIDKKTNGITNLLMLSRLASVDKQVLYNFFKLPKGARCNISFWAGANILTVLGGKILYPGEAMPSPGEQAERTIREKEKEIEKLETKIELLKELLFEKQSGRNDAVSE